MTGLQQIIADGITAAFNENMPPGEYGVSADLIFTMEKEIEQYYADKQSQVYQSGYRKGQHDASRDNTGADRFTPS
jgi:hypothetical protein